MPDIHYACKEKTKYVSFVKAELRCKTIKRRTKRAHILHPYRCKHCSFWHIGHGKNYPVTITKD